MEGGIYTREKCKICKAEGKTVTMKDNSRDAVCCPYHPEIMARRMFVQFGRNHSKRFTVYSKAKKWLNHLRHEKDVRDELFDIQDYSAAKPKSFAVLAPQYLESKREAGRKSIKKIEYIINKATDHFMYTNLRDIDDVALDAFLNSFKGKVSNKTRRNYQTQLHNFWVWARRKRKAVTLAEMPEFEPIEFKLGYRKITTWEIQRKVISRVKEISYTKNPKIWLGIDMLSIYTELRPGDLLRIREGDYLNGFINIYDPTKSERKDQPWITIKLIDEHAQEWERIKSIFPTINAEMLFFRHHKGLGGVKPGSPFGDKFFLKYWNKAAEMEGLEDVPLYPGTRHTTVTETSRVLGPEKAKKATGHRTNKAFDRYNQAINDGAYQIAIEIRKKQMADVVPLKKSNKTRS